MTPVRDSLVVVSNAPLSTFTAAVCCSARVLSATIQEQSLHGGRSEYGHSELVFEGQVPAVISSKR